MATSNDAVPLSRRPATDWRNPTQRELSQEHNPGRSWAWRLRGREVSGDTLNPVQRRLWREALENEVQA
jgi:hypothetical protein